MKKTVAVVAAAAMMAMSGTALAETTAIDLGTAGGDLMRGTARANVMKGLGGNDAIHGKGGNDTLYGNAGHDALYGGSGVDEIRAGDGSDLIGSEGDGEADTVDCGPGVDVVKKSPTEQLDSFVNCERFAS